MSKTKLSYSVARNLADRIVEELRPGTTRIEIAGSVRRQKPEIGDIEIVCIPQLSINLFGDPGGSILDIFIEQLIQDGRITRGDKWGPKYKKLHIPARPDLGIDLFITTPEEWGYTFTIRTGCAEFSHKLVTPRQQGGFLPGHLRVGGCRLWEGDKALETPEESDFLAALGVGWVEPEMREEGRFEGLLKAVKEA